MLMFDLIFVLTLGVEIHEILRHLSYFPCIFSLHIEDNVQVRLGEGLERKKMKYVISFISFSRIFFHKSHL